jgi:methionyl aminopeptidase
LAAVLQKVAEKVCSGISTKELDDYARTLIEAGGDTAAFLNYKPEGASYPYPASLCVSINNEIVHGIPKSDRILKEGDIVSIDLGLKHKGLFTDHAITVPVGKISKQSQLLLDVTQESLQAGIMVACGGNRVGDISAAVEASIKPYGFGIVRELSGHGVGKKIHEDPYIPNFGRKGTGAVLQPGMVIAIEPMINEGTAEVVLAEDDYTFKTKDGKRSAHFEHTILITEGDPEILTQVK